jgi:hypothetical protein
MKLVLPASQTGATGKTFNLRKSGLRTGLTRLGFYIICSMGFMDDSANLRKPVRMNELNTGSTSQLLINTSPLLNLLKIAGSRAGLTSLELTKTCLKGVPEVEANVVELDQKEPNPLQETKLVASTDITYGLSFAMDPPSFPKADIHLRLGQNTIAPYVKISPQISELGLDEFKDVSSFTQKLIQSNNSARVECYVEKLTENQIGQIKYFVFDLTNMVQDL